MRDLWSLLDRDDMLMAARNESRLRQEAEAEVGKLEQDRARLEEAGEALADLTASMLECLADEFGTDHGMPVGFDKKRVVAVNAWMSAKEAE